MHRVDYERQKEVEVSASAENRRGKKKKDTT